MVSSTGNRWTDINLTVSDVEIAKSYNAIVIDNIYVFFSFDLVGSTKFKTEKANWPYVISYFYDIVYKDLKTKIPQIKVWKYLGDEVLLYVSISDFESKSIIYDIPNMVFDTQLKVAEYVQKKAESKKIDVKSTIWIAGAKTVELEKLNNSSIPQADKNYKNLRVKLNVENQDQEQIDFIGPDMDTGFRVAKFAFHHKVVLSADFAYLLYKMSEKKDNKIDDNLQIVSYEILKGVWDEQYYPIVWYYPHWDTAPYGLFYADHKKNDIAERVLSERTDPINKLTQVYEDLGKIAEIDAFVDECNRVNSSKERSFLLWPITKQ